MQKYVVENATINTFQLTNINFVAVIPDDADQGRV